MASSRALRVSKSRPAIALAISPLTLATALRTPLPPYRDVSPSRSSRASRSPVEAPEGTAARPKAPPSSKTSTSTVGFPRESRISRADMRSIFTLASTAAAVGLGFELEDLLAERADERFIVRGDNDHAVVGDGMAAPIFVGVVADEGAAGNEHVAIDDRLADARVASDAHAGHQDALLHVAEAVDADVGTEHAPVDAA